MYIKEITLEGFKSYAQQTCISNFDPHFNAITGLNGSGKSNILDSICFLLGISNLSQVRATNLQELIYKGGNAGITKATVSITFDNLDKNQSPPGYDDYEEITITRQISCGNKHKYLINGQNATAQRVSDLFCSVQLNVNNPNFLIMQGKITKVLNMKPIEILSMIEEAAGTKTYDLKKANALQTIEKKNAKLNEIERVLREDITPQIEKLKQERSAYIEYQKCDREYLHLHKISLAYQYYQSEQICNKNKLETDELDSELTNMNKRIDEINKLNEKLKSEIKEFVDKYSKGGSDCDDDLLSEYENELKQNRVEMAKLNSQLNNLKSSVNTDQKKSKEIQKSIKENSTLIESKQAKLDEMKSNVEVLENDLKAAESELKKAQRDYEALCCGFVVDEDTSQLQTIQDQLLNTRNRISEKNTSVKKAQIKLDNAKKEIDKLKKELETDTKNYDEKQQSFNKQKDVCDKIKKTLDAINFDQNKYDELNLKRRQLNAEVNNLNEQNQGFYAKFPQLSFEYKDPEPNFDRSRVKGLVCNLFKIKDPKFATALETAAGGKLFNLVVDTDQTGKLILQRGELKRKVTIIPMNQIRSNVISEHTVQAAKSLVGADAVFSAMSLIDYNPAYRQVMEYVFGTKLICFNLDSAKKVAFHPNIMTSTITLDGDHFDPEGILTGGSRGERSNLLSKINELAQNRELLGERQRELKGVEQELGRESEKLQKYSKIKNDLDVQENQLNLARINLEQTTHHQKLEKLNNLNAEIDEQKNEIETSKTDLANLTKKLAELEEKAKSKDNNDIEKEKKKAQQRIETAKQLLDKKQTSSSQLQQDFKSITMEIEVLNNEINSFNEELNKLSQNIAKLNEQIETLNKEIEQVQETENKIMDKLNDRKEVIRERNRVIETKSKECDRLEKEKNSIELKKKELDHKKKNLSEQLIASIEKLDHLRENNEWINEEKELFGKVNTVYDFQKQNMKEMHHRLNELKNRKEKLSKQVDMRAMGMLAKKEEEYEELNKKRTIVLRDKSTLETTIEDLEKVKTEVLCKAFDSINKDLGNIFKTLLPGAFAKLELVNKNSLLDGVEFKVAFGDVWKESLTELSGGQRSLVALSLILSLLLYKPAPLYILDEVDAALDTSHTQNIGLMIKKYFKHSQFVIVSLKDGMFNNANVLFKTKLVDGVSTIQRYEQKKKTHDKEHHHALNDQTNLRHL